MLRLKLGSAPDMQPAPRLQLSTAGSIQLPSHTRRELYGVMDPISTYSGCGVLRSHTFPTCSEPRQKDASPAPTTSLARRLHERSVALPYLATSIESLILVERTRPRRILVPIVVPSYRQATHPSQSLWNKGDGSGLLETTVEIRSMHASKLIWNSL